MRVWSCESNFSAAAIWRARCLTSTTSYSWRISIRKSGKAIRKLLQILRYQDRDVIALPFEIAVQYGCNDARMLCHNPGILIQIPPGTESIGMHDEHTLRLPGKRELLELTDLMSQSSVVRGHASTRIHAYQCAGDVPHAGEENKFLLQRNCSDGRGCTPGLAQGIMTVLQD